MLALHVGKLRHRKEFGPVVLLLAAVYTEVVFQRLVLLLRLSISLWVERSTQSTLHLHAVAYLQPEIAGKDTALIRDGTIECSIP